MFQTARRPRHPDIGPHQSSKASPSPPKLIVSSALFAAEHHRLTRSNMPYFPMNTGKNIESGALIVSETRSRHPPMNPPASVTVKNRRKRYLDAHPEYFSADLELAGPLALPSFSLT